MHSEDEDMYLESPTSDAPHDLNLTLAISHCQYNDMATRASRYDGVPHPDDNHAITQPVRATAASKQKPSSAAKKKAAAGATTKRNRVNRYTDAHPNVLSRRRAQNRASQRAYRERKDQKIKDLEQTLNDLTQQNDVLGQAYASLQAMYIELFHIGGRRMGACVGDADCDGDVDGVDVSTSEHLLVCQCTIPSGPFGILSSMSPPPALPKIAQHA